MGPIWWYGGTLLVVQMVPSGSTAVCTGTVGVQWVQQVTRNAIFGAHCAVAGAFPGRRSNAHLGSAHPHQNHHHHHQPPQHHQDPPNADAVCEMKEVEVGAEPALRGEGRRFGGLEGATLAPINIPSHGLDTRLAICTPTTTTAASAIICVSINRGLRQHPTFPS